MPSTSRPCPTSVYLQLRQIAIMRVGPASDLYAFFMGFAGRDLERNHSLVDGLLALGVVLVQEELLQGSHHWMYLSKAVIAWLS